MTSAPKLSTDYFLTSFARQLAANYGRFDKHFVGAHLYFTVHDGEAVDSRTVVFADERPKLFSGHVPLPKEASGEAPFLHLELSLPQLAAFFAGKLDPQDAANADVAFEGNSEGFYRAVGFCL